MLTIHQAREYAAQLYTMPSRAHLTLDNVFCEDIAKLLMSVAIETWNEAVATTIEEVKGIVKGRP